MKKCLKKYFGYCLFIFENNLLQMGNPLLGVNGFLLGVSFLGFSLPLPANLTATQMDDYRAAITCDVLAFICFLLSTTCALCGGEAEAVVKFYEEKRITVTKYPTLRRFAGRMSWLNGFFAPCLSLSGMLALLVSVICLVQVVLGAVAHGDDTLASVLVSILSVSGVVMLLVIFISLPCICCLKTQLRVQLKKEKQEQLQFLEEMKSTLSHINKKYTKSKKKSKKRKIKE